ncbi:MAG: hypothetical protein V3V78_03965 [Candidatus Woesearchaeota archaeon]
MKYSSGCGYSCKSHGNYSIDSLVNSYNSEKGYSGGKSGIDYMIAAEPSANNFDIGPDYVENTKNEVYEDTYREFKRVSQTYSRVVDDFLNPQRSMSAFVGESAEIKDFVEDAFFKVTGRSFPDDVIIHLISEEEMKKIHPRNVVGFAINRKHLGLMSEVFVRKDTLDRVMVILGHELGHVLTRRLENERDEEAKAFAFSLAWMKKIKEENIANLSTAILLDRPAQNGIHDVALDYVLSLIQRGREAIDVWKDLVKTYIRVGDIL